MGKVRSIKTARIRQGRSEIHDELKHLPNDNLTGASRCRSPGERTRARTQPVIQVIIDISVMKGCFLFVLWCFLSLRYKKVRMKRRDMRVVKVYKQMKVQYQLFC